MFAASVMKGVEIGLMVFFAGFTVTALSGVVVWISKLGGKHEKRKPN